MKFLFVDHECHKRTGSAKFFLDIVRKCFKVDEHYYSCYYLTRAEKVVADYDGAIIWEFPISRNKFFFRGKKNVFVPMYDNEWASFWQWKRIAWSGMGVISFCERVTEHARHCGVKNILTLRYFPDPASLPKQKGDPKRVFLWERGDISLAVVEKLFPQEAGYSYEIKKADEFIGRNEYLSRVASCGIVVAPRRKEGIGMAFLEAMAMGKCVVAHNDATMNEYIKDGVNGILFDAKCPEKISESKVKAVLEAKEQTSIFHSGWLSDAAKIVDFVGGQEACYPSNIDRVKIFISYPFYLLEGLLYKIKAIIKKGIL